MDGADESSEVRAPPTLARPAGPARSARISGDKQTGTSQINEITEQEAVGYGDQCMSSAAAY